MAWTQDTFKKRKLYEWFTFAFSNSDDSKEKFFLQNSLLLIKFCDFFRVQAAKIIEQSDANYLRQYPEKFEFLSSPDVNKQKFLDDVELQGKPLLLQDNECNLIHLTSRESECIQLILKNKTAKEIAKILKMSHRTVEAHIYNVKQKLGINYKSQLIERYNKFYG